MEKKINFFPKKSHQSIVNLTKKVKEKKLPSVYSEFDFVSKKHWTDGVFQKKHNPEISQCFLDGSTKFILVNLIFSISKTKNTHNSLNNGVRAVLTAFLDIQFFKAP